MTQLDNTTQLDGRERGRWALSAACSDSVSLDVRQTATRPQYGSSHSLRTSPSWKDT